MKGEAEGEAEGRRGAKEKRKEKRKERVDERVEPPDGKREEGVSTHLDEAFEEVVHVLDLAGRLLGHERVNRPSMNWVARVILVGKSDAVGEARDTGGKDVLILPKPYSAAEHRQPRAHWDYDFGRRRRQLRFDSGLHQLGLCEAADEEDVVDGVSLDERLRWWRACSSGEGESSGVRRSGEEE